MVNQQARLDLHEQQIQQLQSDITEIKASLSTLIADREESREFRQVVVAWMKSQEKKIDDGSTGSGSTSHVFSVSGSKSDLARSPSLLPDLSLDLEINLAVDRSSSPLLNSPSLIVQLEAIISRSEANSVGADDNLPRSDKNTTEQAKLGLIDDNWAISDHFRWALHSSTWVGHDVKQLMVVGRYSPDLGSLYKRFPPGAPLLSSSSSNMTGNPHDTGDFKLHSMNFVQVFHRPINIAPIVRPSQYKIGSELLDVQTFEWKPGWDFGSIEDATSNPLAFVPHVTTILNHLLQHNQLMIPQLNALFLSSENKNFDSTHVTINWDASFHNSTESTQVQLKTQFQIFGFDPGPSFINMLYFSRIIRICQLVCAVLLEFCFSVLGHKLFFTQNVYHVYQLVVIQFRVTHNRNLKGMTMQCGTFGINTFHVYTRCSLSVLQFVHGEVQVESMARELQDRDEALQHLMVHFSNIQSSMNMQAAKKRPDAQFSVGEWVYVKLEAHHQLSVASRINQKLAATIFCPFQIVEKLAATFVGTFFPTNLSGIQWGYKIASPVELIVGSYQLWVVHGQGRPPDDAANPSLEDKTVLKGEVMIGIIF